MIQTATDLGNSVIALRPFVPAKNFPVSKRFYADLGFRAEPLGASLVEMHLGSYSFLLQDYFVQAWAENFMLHMLVSDLDRWWPHIAALDLAARYGVQPPRAPKRESWGLDVAYVFDPAG
ncbi:MAG TPA: glyoxalase, partial [Pseudolabrys sp.]|nr:glyoxalase [Pseudolabrys sp.]